MKPSTKLFVLLAVVLVLGFGSAVFRARRAAADQAAEQARAQARAQAAAQAKAAADAALAKTWADSPRSAVKAAAGQSGAPRAATLKMPLSDMMGPNNRFHDDGYGIAVTLPDGWSIRDGIRWGKKDEQNTLFMKSDPATSSHTSMYYQKYPDGSAPPLDQTQAYFEKLAQYKAQSRVDAGLADYANVPDSFSYDPIDGHPALSYFATFTANGAVQTEYFIRVLGQQGYVMFFTMGSLEDVKAAMPQIQTMAKSVSVP